MAITIQTKLDALKQDLEDKFDPTNDYSERPTIKRGYYTLRDMKGSLPAICFLAYEINLEELFNNAITWVHVMIYGFVQSDGVVNDNEVITFVNDLMYFLYSDDFTYSDDIWISPSIKLLEASPPSKPVGQFVLNIKIKDETTYSTLRGD